MTQLARLELLPADTDASHLLAPRLARKYPDRVTGAFVVPAREGRYVELPRDLPLPLANALRTRGRERLYSHQGACWDAVQRGEDVVVVTPTASGKTLCYTLPVVAGAMTRRSKALYLFPTKALAQDQAAELIELSKAGDLGVRAATFDGDTPGDQRQVKTVRLESPEGLKQHAQAGYQQAVVAKTMPLNNATGITDAERALIGQWFTAGAKAP